MNPLEILKNADVRPTSNRVLILRHLLAANAPMSLIELETELQTLERSSIQRVLKLLADSGIVNLMEDGRGISKYEVCHTGNNSNHDDLHPHFYCEKCHKVYCFKDVNIPHIQIPESFTVRSVNFMLKGLCPDCR